MVVGVDRACSEDDDEPEQRMMEFSEYVEAEAQKDNLYAEIVQARRDEQRELFDGLCSSAGIPTDVLQEIWDGLPRLLRQRPTMSHAEPTRRS
jgi:hypothetical protein